MRELKFQSVHRSFKNGKIEFHGWGPEYREGQPRGFSGISNVTGTEIIGLRQYTEWKDKYGNEIYDQDVVMIEDYEFEGYFDSGVPDNPHEKYKDCNCKVFWSGAGFVVDAENGMGEIPLDYFSSDKISLVGNVYQNPNLITAIRE